MENKSIYREPVDYKALFDYTEKGVRRFYEDDNEKNEERCKANGISFLYLYLMFNPSTQREMYQDFQDFKENSLKVDHEKTKGEVLFDKFNLDTLIKKQNKINYVSDMKKRGLLFAEKLDKKEDEKVYGRSGRKSERLYINPEPFFSLFRFSTLPIEKRKEIWKNSNAKRDCGHLKDKNVSKETNWIVSFFPPSLLMRDLAEKDSLGLTKKNYFSTLFPTIVIHALRKMPRGSEDVYQNILSSLYEMTENFDKLHFKEVYLIVLKILKFIQMSSPDKPVYDPETMRFHGYIRFEEKESKDDEEEEKSDHHEEDDESSEASPVERLLMIEEYQSKFREACSEIMDKIMSLEEPVLPTLYHDHIFNDPKQGIHCRYIEDPDKPNNMEFVVKEPPKNDGKINYEAIDKKNKAFLDQLEKAYMAIHSEVVDNISRRYASIALSYYFDG